jgi:hypothetical protein
LAKTGKQIGATLDVKDVKTLAVIKDDGKKRMMITDMSDSQAVRIALQAYRIMKKVDEQMNVADAITREQYEELRDSV